MSSSKHEPVFNVPGAVAATLAVLVAVHLGLTWLGEEDRDWWILALAFIPARYAGLAAALPGGALASFTSPFTHMVVHGGWPHLLVNSAWLLAFGSVLCRRLGSLRYLALAILSGLAGALTFATLNPGLAGPMIGASGAISGLMGATMRFFFSAINSGRIWQFRDEPERIPRMDLATAFSDRKFLATTIFYVALNLLAIWGVGSLGAVGTVAWEAHLGGYFFGLFAFALFDIALQPSSPQATKVE
jgi:membrane associated rhomboid family serine protease